MFISWKIQAFCFFIWEISYIHESWHRQFFSFIFESYFFNY
jgi:hypothetical protein